MARMRPGLQTAILDWYMGKIKPLLTEVPALQSTYDYMLRCKNTIGCGIYYNEKRAARAQDILLSKLNKLTSDKSACQEALVELRGMVDIVGFKGHLRQHLRQSSKVIEAVFDDFFRILATYYPEIRQLLLDRTYNDLSLSDKKIAQQCLRTDAKYFDTLKRSADQFTPGTQREVDVF